MAIYALHEVQDYLNALSHHETEPLGKLNYSENCSFESFKVVANSLTEAQSTFIYYNIYKIFA